MSDDTQKTGKAMDKKNEVRDYLKNNHTGEDKAVFSSELEQLFSLDGRSIRRIISELRKEGCPICSDQKGYYFAQTQRIQFPNRLTFCESSPGTATDRDHHSDRR